MAYEKRSSPEFIGVREVVVDGRRRITGSAVGRIGRAGRANLLPLGERSNKNLTKFARLRNHYFSGTLNSELQR